MAEQDGFGICTTRCHWGPGVGFQQPDYIGDHWLDGRVEVVVEVEVEMEGMGKRGFNRPGDVLEAGCSVRLDVGCCSEHVDVRSVFGEGFGQKGSVLLAVLCAEDWVLGEGGDLDVAKV